MKLSPHTDLLCFWEMSILCCKQVLCVCRTCVSHCPLGHYEDKVSRRCRRCYKGCERCVGVSVGDCLSCRRGLYLSTLNSSCIDTCHPGYFADESKSTHPQCRPNSVGLLINIWYAPVMYIKGLQPFCYILSVFLRIGWWMCRGCMWLLMVSAT